MTGGRGARERVTRASAEASGRGVFLGQAVQGEKDALPQDHFWTADAGQLTPDRLWAGAERLISAPGD